ncbi:MAG: redoxin domain-containing protein [Edaphobacter sp.]|uniref:redoxin domain-containing protein n=1 Tax=Edaphobacter sp. TaxID=1934404 RepID=UPI0023A25FC5|nr:redoxin domain-containing protein [Edaphobacter sp.]MDE1175438.1 redoxin domain-containing protein [Edaphobacter sp.]
MIPRHSLSIAFLFAAIPLLALTPGTQAPDFKGTDSNGVAHTLSQYRGKYVVLEWANKGCPFDQKHYLSGNMEALQKEWTSKGVVWLSVLSSGPGEQGNMTPAEENQYLKQMKASPTAALLDGDGAIGHLYQAKTTPHIFVIDPKGQLIYQGAIDDRPTTDQADIKGANNYLNDALNAAMAGRPVATQSTRPYGCSVKYKD